MPLLASATSVLFPASGNHSDQFPPTMAIRIHVSWPMIPQDLPDKDRVTKLLSAMITTLHSQTLVWSPLPTLERALGQLSLLSEGGNRRNSGPSWTLSRSPQSWVTMPSIIEAFAFVGKGFWHCPSTCRMSGTRVRLCQFCR